MITIAIAAVLGHGIGYGVGYFRGHRVATEQANRQVNAMAERLGYTVPAAGPEQLHIPSKAALASQDHSQPAHDPHATRATLPARPEPGPAGSRTTHAAIV